MRIAQVPPLAERIPPKLYGGTERVVSWLTEELVALGHEVSLFGTADAITKATLVPVWPSATRLSRPQPHPFAPMASLLEAVAAAAPRFDVIHRHLDWVHIPLLQRLQVPFLTTLHNRLDLPYLRNAARSFAKAPFVSISNNQREPLPGLNWLGTVHHGLPAAMLEFSRHSRGYLAFLGRIDPEKGPETAIRLAKASGLPLRIAAKVPSGKNKYFRDSIQPHVDGSQIQFIGEVGERDKSKFLQNALALLFPIDWPEPFGLVMIEAMACGTPIIAFKRGSVPEVIEDGVSGFVVENEAEALSAIARLKELDRSRVRETFERRFTARRMAEDYGRIYAKLAPVRGSAHTLAAE